MIVVLLIIVAILAAAVVLLLLKTQPKPQEDTTLLEWLKSTQGDLKNLQQTLSETSRNSTKELSETMRLQTKDIHERLTKAAEVIGELKREAGQFSEISRSMKDLDVLLKSPKLRGNLGERVLSDLIAQIFPKHQFYLQHQFKSGVKVDAAIQTEAGIIPIDSKFPMENFQQMIKGETQLHRDSAGKEFARDVKRHIDAIATKYIVPEEGTVDFALMYVPSETVFYEIAANDALLEYARGKRVYPVSPTTFYAHLQTILLSFEGKGIEQKSREVMKTLRSLEKAFGGFEERFALMGKHLQNASRAYDSSSSELNGLSRQLHSAKQLGDKEQTMLE